MNLAYANIVNLSSGVMAIDHHIHGDSNPFITRIPSTWCEQKLWGRILETLPPDFWMILAIGEFEGVFHDISERARPTRATWQGLSWIRYATARAWDREIPVERSRSGMVVSPYWEYVYRRLPMRTRRVLKYYKAYDRGLPFTLTGCPVCAKGADYVCGREHAYKGEGRD